MKISAKEILCSQNPNTDILAFEILTTINVVGLHITLSGTEGLRDCQQTAEIYLFIYFYLFFLFFTMSLARILPRFGSAQKTLLSSGIH